MNHDEDEVVKIIVDDEKPSTIQIDADITLQSDKTTSVVATEQVGIDNDLNEVSFEEPTDTLTDSSINEPFEEPTNTLTDSSISEPFEESMNMVNDNSSNTSAAESTSGDNGESNDSVSNEHAQNDSNQLGMNHDNDTSNKDSDNIRDKVNEHKNNPENNQHGNKDNNSNDNQPEYSNDNQPENSNNNQGNKPNNNINNGGANGNKQGQNAPSFNRGQKGSNGVADNLRNKLNTNPPNNNGDSNFANGTNKNGTNTPSKNGIPNKKDKKNSNAINRIKKIYQNRKNKKKNANNDNSSDTKDDNNSNESTSSDQSNSESNDGESKNKTIARIKRRLYVKLALLGAVAFLFYALIMIVASALTGGAVFKVAPVESAKNYGTDDFQTITDDESSVHQDELDYYQKLKEINEEYGDEINVDYVNALLLEVFYEYDADFAYENEEEAKKLQDSGGIDFAKMTRNADSFAKVIKDADSDDYSINGVIYNAIKESSIFKSYYREVLRKKNSDEVLENVFTLAEEMGGMGDYDETVVTSETKVEVTEKTETTPKKTTKSRTLSMTEYLADVIYTNTSALGNSEAIKAYTIAYSTNVVAKNRSLTITSNIAQMSEIICDVKLGCSYDSDGDLVDGPGKRSSKNTIYYNGGYYYKKPLSNSEITSLNKSVNSVFGNVLVTTNGTYATLDISKIGGFGSSDYQTILNNAYDDKLTLKNIGENSYILDGSYGEKKVLTNVIFYDQGDYSSYSFCGLKKETIKSSGCGVTSMAMVVSTYSNNRKYDPIYMNKEATKKGLCGSNSGTAQSFFCKEAKELGYRCLSGRKQDKTLLNYVLKHLSQGHLVVVRIGPGHFTGGGHYMVLGGIDPDTKKVYVYDPNNNSNSSWRKTGNGWYSFNDIIVKEAYNFYIIWKG